MTDIEQWCNDNNITEVECLIPDIAGIPRGKILPTKKFLSGIKEDSHRLPESALVQTVTGDYPDSDDVNSSVDIDVILRPDLETIRMVPWYTEPTAQIICDSYNLDGSPVEMSCRGVLKRVLSLFSDKGWNPVVAPELEFFLVAINADPDYPLEPPIGRSGRPETGRQAFGIDAVNEFDPLFEDVYDYCEAQNIDIDTLNHEGGAAQFEINFQHGNALDLADQVFLFKRTVRQTGTNHGVHATFMAKPLQYEPGSSMHIHQSILDNDGKNIFVDEDGNDTDLFFSYIAGLQKYLPATMALLAPNINSYRRFIYEEAPINSHWGYDNRTCGLRVPSSPPIARRVENRLAGSDVNPYLGMVGTLVCGYLGMIEGLKPEAPHSENVYHLPRNLPMHQDDALSNLGNSDAMAQALGKRFIDTFVAVKEKEFDTYSQVISSWEREHLLLNV